MPERDSAKSEPVRRSIARQSKNLEAEPIRPDRTLRCPRKARASIDDIAPLFTTRSSCAPQDDGGSQRSATRIVCEGPGPLPRFPYPRAGNGAPGGAGGWRDLLGRPWRSACLARGQPGLRHRRKLGCSTGRLARPAREAREPAMASWRGLPSGPAPPGAPPRPAYKARAAPRSARRAS